MPERKARVERNTSETKIVVELNLDGSGKYDIDTGIVLHVMAFLI